MDNIINICHSVFAQHNIIVILSKIVLILLLVAFLHFFLLNKFIEKFPIIYAKYNTKADRNFIEQIVRSVKEPTIIFLWLMSILIIIESIYQKSFYGIKFFSCIIVITWLLFKILKQSERYLINFVYQGEQKNLRQHKTTIIAVVRLLKIFLTIILVLMAMQALHIDITGIVAIGGASTIVIGIAAQQLLANFFGGMMIFMDRQFMVGDSIKSPNQEIEGTVEYIGWRLTKIRTLDGSLLYVPNSTFLSISVENSSKRHNRRIKEIIRLKYKDLRKINLVLDDLATMLRNNPDIDNTKMCFVGIHQFNYMAVDCLLWCFTKTTDLESFLKVQHDILYKINSILSGHEVEIAFTSLVDPESNKILNVPSP